MFVPLTKCGFQLCPGSHIQSQSNFFALQKDSLRKENKLGSLEWLWKIFQGGKKALTCVVLIRRKRQVLKFPCNLLASFL